MKTERETWSAVFNTDLYDAQAVKTVGNVCFGVLVLTVLTFTVIAVTYQPPDPWLQPSKPFAKLLTLGQNATSEPDESVIITAEDAPLASPVSGPAAVNLSFVDEEIALIHPSVSDCKLRGPVNCSDPGVLFAIEKFNLQVFSALDFYAYRSPVRGSTDSECDVAWKYRSSKDGSPRKFRDYRRYSVSLVSVETVCKFHVDKIGDWHSGENARPRNRVVTPSVQSAPDSRGELGVDLINDGLLNMSENSFRQQKYVYYERGGDHCKSMSQYMWSLLCALGEARFLNRTFVMDMEVCLSKSNNPGHDKDEPGKDFRFYYDFEHLRSSLSVIDEAQFLKDWHMWDATHPSQKIVMREVEYKTTPMELRKDRSTTVLKRVFNDPEPNNYWFRVCEGDTQNTFQRPWHALWKSRRINDIVLAICGKMGWEYDAVHVVRGEKAINKDKWPHLDADTSPEALIRKLDDTLIEGRNVYIATNEQDDHYFDRLRAKWRIFRLDDFNELWKPNSEWYNETMELNRGIPVDFDGYMRVEVDSEVLYKAKNRIETFNDLTKDCKNGIGACLQPTHTRRLA